MKATAKFKALVQGGTQHVRTALGKARELSRRRPRLALGVGVGVLALALVAAGFVLDWHEDAVELVQETVLAKPTLAELKRRAKAEPRNAQIQRDLGHAYFAQQGRTAGLLSYRRALDLDGSIGDQKMVTNLLACFGRREQAGAANLIAQYRLTAASERLSDLVRDRRRNVRGDALRALADMGRAARSDFVAYYLLDLEAADCDTRRRAVEKLASYADRGDKRILAAIRAAAKKDEENTPWYRRECLTDAAAQAEKKILARR